VRCPWASGSAIFSQRRSTGPLGSVTVALLVQRRQSTGPDGLVTVGCGRRRRRRRRSSFRPCLPLFWGFSNLFHGFPVQRRQSTGPEGLVTVGRGRRRRRRRRSTSSSPSSSFTFPSVSSSVIGVFQFLPWFPLCCSILVSLV
jgi:hypothetical protein